MRWPPNAAWTSAVKREGYRHFEVKSYGGKKDERWVELFPVNNNEILIRVPWSELKTYSSGRVDGFSCQKMKIAMATNL